MPRVKELILDVRDDVKVVSIVEIRMTLTNARRDADYRRGARSRDSRTRLPRFFPATDDRASLHASLDRALRDRLDLRLIDANDGPWLRRTYGPPAIALHFELGREWSQVMAYPITRAAWNVLGADGLRRLFDAMVTALPIVLARTFREGGFTLVREGELTGQIDALGWGQFYNAAIARRLESYAADLVRSSEWSAGPGDGRWLFLGADPWMDDVADDGVVELRERWAARLGLALRAWPDEARERRAEAKRIRESLAPDAPAWNIEASRREIARGLTSTQRDAAIAPYEIVERALLSNEVPAPIALPLLEAAVYLEIGLQELAIVNAPPLASLQQHVQAAVAARAWSDVLDAAKGPLKAIAVLGGTLSAQTIKGDEDLVHLDPVALEGLLKMAAWGRMTYADAEVREIVLETLMRSDSSRILHFARRAPTQTVIGGMLALQHAHIGSCQTPACARRRERLAAANDQRERRSS
jgi:hypothetical protein